MGQARSHVGQRWEPSATAGRHRNQDGARPAFTVFALGATGGMDMTASSRPSRARNSGLPSSARCRPLFGLAAALAVAAAVSLAPAPGAAADAGDRPGVVAVIDRTDIALSGHTTLSELLSSRDSFNGFGRYGALLGTGSSTTLVNGRPVASLNLSTLPLAAVERVEILNEGPVRHSAYAIGRTTNIVLRKGFEGVEVSAAAGRPSQEGLDSQRGSALWGGALGRGHLVIGAAHIGREEVRDKDRDYSKASYTPGGSVVATTGVSISGNSIVYVPAGTDSSVIASLGDCDPSVYTGVLSHPQGEVCGFPYAAVSWALGYQQLTRESLFVAADHPLGDAADLYVEARIAQGENLLRYAPPVGSFTVEAPAASTLRQNLIDNVEGLDETTFPDDNEVRLRHRFVAHGNREWTTDLEEHELTVGVRGDLDDDLGYDVHGEYYRHSSVRESANQVSASLARAAILSGAYDVVNPLSPADPARHERAIRDMTLRLNHDVESEFLRASASLEGETLTMAGGAIGWTLGVGVEDWDWRNVHDYRDSQNRFHEVADVLGAGDETVVAGRRVVSVLAESTLPLLDGWDLTLGARRDDYDDVGEAVSLHAANRYRLDEALAFRASWAVAAHPPSLSDLHSPESESFPRVCDPLNTGGDGAPVCGQEKMFARGNPDLEPSETERIGVGATAAFGAFSFSADWFRSRTTDLASTVSAQTVVDRAAAGSPLPGTSVQRVGQQIERIDNPTVQAGESETRGVALHAGAGWEAGWADLALDVYATRTLHHEYRVLDVEQPGDYPRNRAHALLRASRGDFTASWSAYARSGQKNVTESARFKSWYGHDLALQWRDVLGIGLDLAGGVLNIADRGPSIDPSLDEEPILTLDAARGRTLFLNATMRW